MKLSIVLILLIATSFLKVIAQSISISPDGSPPDSSAILDIQSTTKGLLIPRMTQEQRDSILLPVLGLTIFQTDGIPGMYYYDGAAWTTVGSSTPVGDWPQNGDDIYNNNPGNIGIGTSVPEGKLHIKGSIDASELIIEAIENQSNTNPMLRLRKNDGTDLMWIHTDCPENVFIGKNAGKVNDEENLGIHNTFIGSSAGALNTTGLGNTGTGSFSLSQNTIGSSNTGDGYQTLSHNVTANQNTAVGCLALAYQSYNPGIFWNSDNTAVGFAALNKNQPISTATGIANTAVGSFAMQFNTTGWDNTALGAAALYSNISGRENTAIGRQSLFYNDDGWGNTATGYKALRQNTFGWGNSSYGNLSLFNNTEGAYNAAFGFNALYSNTLGSENTAIGIFALSNIVTGLDNIAVGYNSGVAAWAPNLINTVNIGNYGYLNQASNQDFIGNLSTAWIGGQTTWYTYASDARVKNNVQEDVKGLDFISRLRPVTYNLDITAMREITGNEDTEDYPEKYDIEKIKQSGFLAQEVEQAAKTSGYNFNGFTTPKTDKELYTMSYSLFVVPLVKAVQELSQQNIELKDELNLLKAENENLAQRIEKIESILNKK